MPTRWHVDAGRGAGCRGFGRVQVRARSGEGRHYDLLRRSRCGRSRSCGKKTGEQSTLTGALKIEDEPCVVMMSATGLIARTTPSAMDVFNARSTSDERLRDDQITTIFETSTRATYGLVTSAGRLVLAHVVDLPALPATATLSLKGGVQADELIGMTESTDPIRGERVITAIAMEQPTSGKTSAKDESEDGGAAEAKPLPSLAIGTRNGVIKRWNREAPTPWILGPSLI